MKRTLLNVFICLTLSSCAAQPALIEETPSGYPEGVFEKLNIEAVRSKIMDGCGSQGLQIQEANTNQIVCGKTLNGKNAVLATMIVGNSYSTPPEMKVKFTVFQLGKNVKVTANQWVESQMAFGQLRRQELNSNQQRNDIQLFLFELGARQTNIKPSSSAESLSAAVEAVGACNKKLPSNRSEEEFKTCVHNMAEK